jgi:hypothetical protein
MSPAVISVQRLKTRQQHPHHVQPQVRNIRGREINDE